VNGRLWAQLAWVARRDAEACIPETGSREFYKLLEAEAGLSPGDKVLREVAREEERTRLGVLAARFEYKALEHGFTKYGTDYVFGDSPQDAFKACACGRLYEYRFDWEALPLAGRQTIDLDDGEEGYALEFRNCPCGSTLAIEVSLCAA
jgi:hypothetical protein